MKYLIIAFGLILHIGSANAQDALLSGGGTQANSGIHHQFAVGNLAFSFENEEGIVLGGLQQVILNCNDINYPTDTTSVSTKDLLGELNLRLYPNPTQEKVIIDHQLSESLSYQLLTVSGAQLQEGIIDPIQDIIDLKSYEPGIYYLTINRGNSPTSITILINKQ